MPRKGNKPARYLGLHRPAWLAARKLLRDQEVSVPLRVRVLYGWRSRLFTLAWQARAPMIQQASVAAFVCGFWRSGTTLLHECLALDTRWRAPTTQQCMNPGQPPLVHTSNSTLRPMDKVRIDANSPQEDEFGLLATGAPSFYRVLVCPSAWPALLEELQAGASAANWPDRVRGLREFLSYVQSVDSSPLLLKSPTHAFCLPDLLDTFPEARAVIILRDWRAVWMSCQRMWRAMFELYAIGPWTPDTVADLTTAAYRAYATQLERQCNRLPFKRVAAIRYEDLVSSPVDTLRALAARLGGTVYQPEETSIRRLLAQTRPDSRQDSQAFRLTSDQHSELEACYRKVQESVAKVLVAPT